METPAHYLQPVELSGNNKRTSGEVTIELLSTGQRILKAVGMGLIGLLITLFSVAIPLLHFILVPLGLILTVVLVNMTFRKKEIIAGGHGKCAFCNADIEFVRRGAKFPFLERCGACSRESLVNKA